MSKINVDQLVARMAALEEQNKVLLAASQAVPAAVAPVVVVSSAEKESTMEFLDMRKEQIVQITACRDFKAGEVCAQVRMNHIIKWNKEERGVPSNTWLRDDIEKPSGVDGAMVSAYPMLKGKGKKGFFYVGHTTMSVKEAKQVVSAC